MEWVILAVVALFLLGKDNGLREQALSAARRLLKEPSGAPYRYQSLVGAGGTCNYAPLIDTYKRASTTTGVPWKLLAAQTCIESGVRWNAISHVGACGISQIMPRTGRGLGLTVAEGIMMNGREFPVTTNPTQDERFDPIKAINAQARLLKHDYAALGSWDAAMAAYRSGIGNVRKRGINEGDRGYINKIRARMSTIPG